MSDALRLCDLRTLSDYATKHDREGVWPNPRVVSDRGQQAEL